MKKRLFVFGCSYSAYIWPTWADFIGIGFDEKWNYAQPGIGNRAIFERLMQAISKHDINANDTVIVQWTHHTRHDWHLTRDILDRGIGWQTNGSIFMGRNIKFFTRDWLQRFFDEESYIMHSLNFMLGAKLALDKIGCRTKYVNLLDFELFNSEDSQWERYDGIVTNLGGKVIATKTTKIVTIWEKFPKLAHYKSMYDSIDWLPNMKTWMSANGEDRHYKLVRSVLIGPATDPHPTAPNHLAYAKAMFDLSEETINTANEWVKIIEQELKGGRAQPGPVTEAFEQKLPGWRMYFYEM
jgi:hypothetical protein